MFKIILKYFICAFSKHIKIYVLQKIIKDCTFDFFISSMLCYLEVQIF